MLGARLYWSKLADPQACLAEAEALKKSAVQFHQVLREIFAVTTPIPFRFPTMLESDEVFEEHLAPEQELYREALARVEMPCNMRWSGRGRKSSRPTLAAGQRTRISGAAKGGHRTGGRSRGKLKSVTADSVREWRGRQERKTHRWFALVPRESRERFLASLRTAGGSEGIRLRLSGPWPPSEFVMARGERG